MLKFSLDNIKLSKMRSFVISRPEITHGALSTHLEKKSMNALLGYGIFTMRTNIGQDNKKIDGYKIEIN